MASPSSFSGVLLGVAGLGVRPVASTSVRPVGGDPPLPSSSEASSELLGLGAGWKSARASQNDQFALLELAPSLALDGFQCFSIFPTTTLQVCLR
jgi:hypothetical protein